MEAALTFMGGVVLGALSSWFIAHRYYIKASADQRTELTRLEAALRPQHTLEDFERLLQSSTWEKTDIDYKEVWVCAADNTFQIVKGDQSREFNEQWTTVYPDRHSYAYPVYLRIGGSTVKELTFISMDGGRIFVPMAEVRPVEETSVEHFWRGESLAVKVCRVIGDYYIYEDLEGVARKSNVALLRDA